MIKIKLAKNHIEINGHANYDKYGKDIVCAAVSTIATTSINIILSFDKNAIKYKADEGLIIIDILKHNKETDVVINNMINMLKELEKDYKKNIKIYEEV